MWRTRGPRPSRGPRCCSTTRLIIRRALKSQLHDGRAGAAPSSPHVEQSLTGLGLQVSIQHLPTLPTEIHHALPHHGPVASSDGVELPTLQLQEQLAAGDGGECSCDSAPSTSRSARILNGSSRWRAERAMNSRDAAALTRRITHTQSTRELQAVLQHYRLQLNAIHISAAIVKLAKLTAVEGGRQRLRHGLVPGQDEVLEERSIAATGAAGAARQGAASSHHRSVLAFPHLDIASDPVGTGTTPATAADALQRVRRRGGCLDEEQLGISSSRSSRDGTSSDTDESRAVIGNSLGSPDSEDRSRLVEVERQEHTRGTRTAGVCQSSAAMGEYPTRPADPNPDRGPLQPALERVLNAAPFAPAEGAPPSALAALLTDLVSGFLTQLPHYTARQYANVVWALAAMGSRSHPELLAAAAAQLQAHGAAKLFAAPPQELSNLALGLAKLGYRDVSLWAAIIAAGKARLHEFKPQELHNMAWAVAAASQDRSMISAVVQAALPQLWRFNASGLSNLLWACAAAQCPCEELFDGAAAALMALPPQDVNCQDVANTAWACAKLQHKNPQLMAHLARLLLAAATVPGGLGLQAAGTQELVNMLWAVAVLPLPLSLPVSPFQAPGRGADGAGDGGAGSYTGANDVGRGLGLGLPASGWGSVGPAARPHSEEQPWQVHWLTPTSRVAIPPGDSGTASWLPSLGSAAAVHGPQLQPPSSGSSSSSLSSAVQSDSPPGASSSSSGGSGSNGSGLLESIVRVLVTELSRRQDLSPQGAANALWACARLQPCPLPAASLSALLDAATRRCSRMADQELANALWAVAELRNAGLYVPYGTLESLFAAACCSNRLEAMAPAGLAQVVHAAVALRRVPTGHMDVLAQHVLRRLPELGPQELCVVAVAVAEAVRIARYCNPLLLNGLANAAVALVGELRPQAISTLLWSFARAKHYHGPLTTALCRAAKPRLRRFSDMELSNLVYALAMLKCQDRPLLVLAARVLVERVRLRRQRRAASATASTAALRPQRSPKQPHPGSTDWQRAEASAREEDEEEEAGEQPQRLLREFVPVLAQASVETGNPEQVGGIQREQEGSGVSDEMASALASHRLQQQQQWRRRQQQQQEPQQMLEGESQLVEVAAARSRPQCLSASATADGDRDQLAAESPWQRAGWGAQESRPQHAAELHSIEPSTGAGSTALVASVGSSSDGGESGSSALAASVDDLPADDRAAAEALRLQPEPRLRLRRLPALHHQDDVDRALQPRRPPPRDGCSGTASAGAARVCRGPSDSEPSPGGTGAGAGVLPQRAASSTDEADTGEDAGAGPTPRDHAKSMAKLLWSYAKCNLYNQSLFRLLVQELQPVLRHATPHEVTLALWAVACHGHRCPEFLDAAAATLLRGRMRQLCPWDSSVVAWAFAKLGHQHRGLFEALQGQARAAGGAYKEPCLLRLAWACAAVEVPLQEQLLRRVVDLKQRERRRAAYSSYDGADGEMPAAVDAARVEGEW